MSEEQIIYLDPKDELTSVREKIEEVQARRITLLVPQQTQLRSNVGWRLLHARARELGKEIQVISPDRQVRAVAKAAGFRVSQPQEGSSPGKIRNPLTRPSQQPQQPQRGVTERRGIQRQRGPVNRGPADSRITRQRESLPPSLPPAPPTPPPPLREEQSPAGPYGSAQSTWTQQANQPARPEEPASGRGLAESSYPPLDIVEDDALDQPFEFRINETKAPSARPLAARPEEEHEDPYSPDYDFARRIREAAQGTSSSESNPPREEQEPTSTFPTSRYSTPPEPIHANPFEGDIEEFSPSLLPEQHGPTFTPDADDIAPDVADIPTDVHQIEYLDDRDEPGGSQSFPAQQWSNAPMNEQDESAAPPASDAWAMRGRAGGSRSGKIQNIPDEEDEDFLPPPDQPTLIRPNRPATSGSLGTPRTGRRGARPPLPPPVEPPPAARSVTTRPIPQPAEQPRPITRNRIPAAPPPAASTRRRRASRGPGRRSRATTVVVVVLLLLLLIGIGFLYFGTTATVTLTVPTKALSLNSIKLVASTKTQSKFPNSVTSQLLTYNASVSGTGTATGSTQQGNVKASGTVLITNNGQQNVTIPTGTVLSTNAGAGSVQFVTTASPVIPPTSAIPVPVEAQNAGKNGNVGVDTIKVIPAASITAIALASSLNSTQINLSVTNPNALSGGGAASVPAATQKDLQALTNALHPQLQAQIKTWLQGQVHHGDIAGTPSPDIVDSAQPLPQEQLTQAPGVGSSLPNKTFTGVLGAKISVLVVRSSAQVAAAQSQLNAAALATRPSPYILATQVPISISNVSSTASKDGTSITITLSASGLAMLRVATQELSVNLAGKTVDQAKSAIASGDAGPRGVEDIKIEPSPSFLGIMPFRSEHIHIIVLPGTQLPKG